MDITITISEPQAVAIVASLRRSSERAEDKVANASSEEEKSFYENIKTLCDSVVVSIIAKQLDQRVKCDDEDVCPECGEDVGFCQCEEEEDDQ